MAHLELKLPFLVPAASWEAQSGCFGHLGLPCWTASSAQPFTRLFELLFLLSGTFVLFELSSLRHCPGQNLNPGHGPGGEAWRRQSLVADL